MNRLFARWCALAFATFALAVSTGALPPPVQAQAMNCNYTAGAGGAFTLQCTPSLSCSIGASSSNVQPNNSITLTASCQQALTSPQYVWSLLSGDPTNCPKGFVAGAVQNLTAGNVTSPACTYQVAITDTSNGKGGTPSVTVSWTTAPPAAPTGCVTTLTTAPSPLTTAAFTATPSVTCATPPAASLTYTWTKNSVAWAGAVTASPQDSEAANTGSAAITYTYAPTVCNGPANGSNCVMVSGVTASQPGSGGGGGGGQYSCHTLNPAVISGNTTTINLSWATPQTNVPATMGVNDAIVVTFTTGPNSSSNFSRVTGAEWLGTPASTRISVLSTQPCDFTGIGFGSNPYVINSNSTVNNYFTVGVPGPNGFPVLQPNTQYFVNIKNAPSPACASDGGNCEMFISLYKGNGS